VCLPEKKKPRFRTPERDVKKKKKKKKKTKTKTKRQPLKPQKQDFLFK
jgi:hypothetical protein